MEEEAVGTSSLLGANHQYASCARCGAFGLASSMHATAGDAIEDRTEYVLLCDACQRDLANGEQDLPPQSD